MRSWSSPRVSLSKPYLLPSLIPRVFSTASSSAPAPPRPFWWLPEPLSCVFSFLFCSSVYLCGLPLPVCGEGLSTAEISSVTSVQIRRFLLQIRRVYGGSGEAWGRSLPPPCLCSDSVEGSLTEGFSLSLACLFEFWWRVSRWTNPLSSSPVWCGVRLHGVASRCGFGACGSADLLLLCSSSVFRWSLEVVRVSGSLGWSSSRLWVSLQWQRAVVLAPPSASILVGVWSVCLILEGGVGLTEWRFSPPFLSPSIIFQRFSCCDGGLGPQFTDWRQ